MCGGRANCKRKIPAPAKPWYKRPAILAPIVAALFTLVASLVPAILNSWGLSLDRSTAWNSPEPGQSSPFGVDTTIAPPESSSSSMEELCEALEGEHLTALQKEAFRSGHAGRVVEWAARVREVKPSLPGRADSPIIMTLEALPEQRGCPGRLVRAFFDPEQRIALLQFSPGDRIVLQGTLSFDDTGSHPEIRRAHVLRHLRCG